MDHQLPAVEKTHTNYAFRIVFLLLIILFAGCTTTLNLTLDGKKMERIFGHNNAKTIGCGMPEGGQYSGPGVKDGMFTPGLAGNGIQTITYSKFGYLSSKANIEVFGAPSSISDRICNECGGKQRETCPICGGAKKTNNRDCIKCEGTGTISCQKCIGDEKLRNDYTVITDLLSQLSCCRLSHEVKYGRTDDFILKLHLKFGYFEEFNPVLYLYIIESATGKMKKYTLPSRTSEEIVDEKGARICKQKGGETSPVSFLFKIEEDELIESNIRIIEIAAHYGNYNVSLFFDLKDIANGDEYLQEDIRVKSMLFNEKCCVFPKTIFVDEMNDELEKVTRDKGWQTEEMDFGWLLQKNSQGDKRILDRNRRLRMQSGEKIKPEVVNDYWKDIKYQLENNYDFWNNWLKKVPPVTIEIWSKQLSEK